MFGVISHVLPWQAAAAMRDKVMLEATPHVTAGCDEISVANLPDAVQGAYVFRNGAPQAFARTLGLHVVSGHVAGGCSLVWNDVTSSFDSPSAGR
jgi:hypothetical protein